ncbi:hypothetical protein KKG83_06445 [Candidatus Micrarchaeota archaeon]|nr:hypothetical protein [Candidatus Micrarchaeota archaeon]
MFKKLSKARIEEAQKNKPNLKGKIFVAGNSLVKLFLYPGGKGTTEIKVWDKQTGKAVQYSIENFHVEGRKPFTKVIKYENGQKKQVTHENPRTPKEILEYFKKKAEEKANQKQ